MNHPQRPPSIGQENGTAPQDQWVIVTQVKSNRVVYFTDDPDYQPPMEGDWYYCSPYGGTLPAEMTLRNCWGWRFNGGVFTDAREAPDRPAAETLIDSNRKALMTMLREKIDTVREPFLPSCQQGDQVRLVKLAEAQAFLAGQGDAHPYLQAAATARNISLLEMARLIVAKAQETQRLLLETERFREMLSHAIRTAKTHAQLLQVRNWLLDQVYPQLSHEFKFRIENTEPMNLEQPLGETQRQHEIARLKAQLREVINAQRAAVRSDYVQNDEIRKFKAQMARAVLQNGGKPPPGLDITLLENYAQARGLELLEAAQAIVNAMAASAEVLARSEQTKDRLLARIEAVKTLADLRVLSAELDAMGMA